MRRNYLDPFHDTLGASGGDHWNLPTSDDTTNTVNPAFLNRARYTATPDGRHALRAQSPPHDPGSMYGYEPSLLHNPRSSYAGPMQPNHPPTPPRRGSDYEQLMPLYQQQQVEPMQSRYQVPSPYTSTIGLSPSNYASSSNYIQPSPRADSHYRRLSAQSSSSPAVQEPHTLSPIWNQQVSSEAPSEHNRGSSMNILSQPFGSMLPSDQSLYDRIQNQSYFSYHAQQALAPSPYLFPPGPTPAIQEWPTHSLAYRPSHEPMSYLQNPSPADSIRPTVPSFRPDSVARVQESRTGGRSRKRPKELQEPTQQHQPPPTVPKKRTRKSSASVAPESKRKQQSDGLPTPKVPPKLRQSHVSKQHQPVQAPARNRGPGFGVLVPVSSHEDNQYTDIDMTEAPSKQPTPLPIDWDTLPQAIAPSYEDYHWSVTHYTINPTSGFEFAQSWLETLFNLHVPPNKHKQSTHTSVGFIKGGTRLSFLALHNAATHFSFSAEYPPASSTSIGVYGRFWHDHDEIHWTTITPGIKHVLDSALSLDAISVSKIWKHNMPLATDRRFHRAYWLAANMQGLKGLLNQGTMKDVAHDAVEEDGEREEWMEGELDCEWDVDWEGARVAWERVVDRNEFGGDGEVSGYEHMPTGLGEGG